MHDFNRDTFPHNHTPLEYTTLAHGDQPQKKSWQEILYWVLFGVIGSGLLLFFLFNPTVQLGGDVVEYYGMTESLTNHAGLNLTDQDKAEIEQRIGPDAFRNTEYYIEGNNNQYYAGHFAAYSILNVPIRVLLDVFQDDPAKMFRITNTLILFAALGFVSLKVVTTTWQRYLLLGLTLLSPILSLLVWPGPEVYIYSFLLLSFFLYAERKYLPAIACAVLASWQSQPLVLIPAALLAFHFNATLHRKELDAKYFYSSILLGLLMIVPNIYYFITLGSFSAFAKLQAVSSQSITLQRLVDFFIDPNIGFFWYIPVLVVIGIVFAVQLVRRQPLLLLVLPLLAVITALFATISNWNHGTAGYGPSRYSVLIIALLTFMAVRYLKPSKLGIFAMVLAFATQGFMVWMNGAIMPDFANSRRHNLLAQTVLNYAPQLYNPSEEIFFERTSGRESAFFGTIVYKDSNGNCTKALAFPTERAVLEKECGFIPPGYETDLDNPFTRIAPNARTVTTTEATFYPAEGACAWDFKPTDAQPFTCIRTLEDAVKMTGVRDTARFTEVAKDSGVWQIKWGPKVTAVVPPGYVINHYSFDGIYVNYPR